MTGLEIGNDFTEESKVEKGNNPKQISRREFLRLFGVYTIAALVAARSIFSRTHVRGTDKVDKEGDSSPIDEVSEKTLDVEADIVDTEFTPSMIHNIEVYGINEDIETLEDITKLYKQIDTKWEEENQVKIEHKFSQRRELLDPKERYVEFLILQSAYDSFERRAEETGVDFVEWIKLHVDSMNLCFKNAKPTSELKLELRRILVVQDGAYDPIWTEEAWRNGTNPALDWAHKLRFCAGENPFLPLNTDESWAIPTDYRDNPNSGNPYNSLGGYFWSASFDGSKVDFKHPPGGNMVDRFYNYPYKSEAMRGRKNVWLDFGIPHELLHYAFNMPDEYAADINIDGKGIMHLLTGSFHGPWVSPYLSILSRNHIAKNLRNPYLEGGGVGYSFFDVPSEVTITGSHGYILDGIKFARRGTKNPQYFNPVDDRKVRGNKAVIEDKKLIEHDAPSLKLEFRDTKTRRRIGLYFPYLAFNMSHYNKIAHPKYRIEVLSDDISETETQFVHILDESDIGPESKILGGSPYHMKVIAKAKIDGTNAYYVWFQKDH